MAWGTNNKDLVVENVRLEAKLEAAEQRIAYQSEQIAELKEMLSRTQEALVAKESPEAYRDRKYAEYEAARGELTDEEKETLAAQRRRAETNAQYLADIEGPMFRGPEEMMDLLSRPMGVPQATSLHNNGES